MEANILSLDISSYCSIFIMSQYVYMEKLKYKIFDCNKTYPSVVDNSIYVNVKILDYTLSFFTQFLIFSKSQNVSYSVLSISVVLKCSFS